MPRIAKLSIKHYPGHGNKEWQVYFRGKTHWFETEADAQKQVDDWKGGRRRALTPREHDDYLHCTELLAGARLIDAVRYYNEHQPRHDLTKTVVEAIAEHFNKIKGRPKYLAEKKRNLRILGELVGSLKLTAVSRQTMETTLEEFESDWSHDDFLKHSRQFFNWCVGKTLLSKDPTEGIERKDPKGKKVWLNLADTDHILRICRSEFKDLLPAVALQLFGGVRTAEITRLEWKYIRRGAVNIEVEVSKMEHRRVIDWWPESLKQCMPRALPRKGKLVHDFVDKKTQLLARCRETKADFVWGQNAMRHSYATYGCAFHQNAGRMALLIGDRDMDVFFNNYREYVSQAEGKKYFARR